MDKIEVEVETTVIVFRHRIIVNDACGPWSSLYESSILNEYMSTIVSGEAVASKVVASEVIVHCTQKSLKKQVT